jgi:hypothetical protein
VSSIPVVLPQVIRPLEPLTAFATNVRRRIHGLSSLFDPMSRCRRSNHVRRRMLSKVEHLRKHSTAFGATIRLFTGVDANMHTQILLAHERLHTVRTRVRLHVDVYPPVHVQIVSPTKPLPTNVASVRSIAVVRPDVRVEVSDLREAHATLEAGIRPIT